MFVKSSQFAYILIQIMQILVTYPQLQVGENLKYVTINPLTAGAAYSRVFIFC